MKLRRSGMNDSGLLSPIAHTKFLTVSQCERSPLSVSSSLFTRTRAGITCRASGANRSGGRSHVPIAAKASRACIATAADPECAALRRNVASAA
jgi:hypothetical protein